MAVNAALNPVRVRQVDTRLLVDVPWGRADGVQTHLGRYGIRSTLILDALEQRASLELWPGTNEAAARAALAGWAG
ncbi:MAG TPA: hypothetical protein VJ739_18860 [Gemmataceae bacterium]|nr:hypothetical protein [Gemmataceae bacterium]